MPHFLFAPGKCSLPSWSFSLEVVRVGSWEEDSWASCLGWILRFTTWNCVTLSECLDFSEPWVHHLEMIVRLVPTPRIIVMIRLLIQYFDKCLAHGKCSVNVSCYCSDYIFKAIYQVLFNSPYFHSSALASTSQDIFIFLDCGKQQDQWEGHRVCHELGLGLSSPSTTFRGWTNELFWFLASSVVNMGFTLPYVGDGEDQSLRSVNTP